MEWKIDFIEKMPSEGRMYFYVFAYGCIMLSFHVSFLPGTAGPKDFAKGDPLTVEGQRLTSVKTRLSDSYYSLPYGIPKKIVDDNWKGLGKFLASARLAISPYEFKMGEPQMCHVVCRTILNAKDVKELKERIDDEYRVNMILDNLPLVVPYNRSYTDSSVYHSGFPVGVKVQYGGKLEQKYFINNHLAFTVKYHKDKETDVARIVGFEAKPFSVKHGYECKNEKLRLTNCTLTGNDSQQEVEDEKEIIFTYDVEFQESGIKWASRADAYLYMLGDDVIHCLSIFISMIAVTLHLLMLANIFIPCDVSKDDQLEEEVGWMLVLGDIFRPPTNSDLLCVYAGTSVQIFGTILFTMIFAALGFLSPSNRGKMMTTLLSLWACMGLFAGYTSASLHAMLNAKEWRRIILKTSFMFPGILIFFISTALSWGEGSSGAIPFGAMFALVLKWLCVSVPLVLVDSYVGFKKPAIEGPVKINGIPKEIPEQAWFVNPVLTILIGGAVPFSVASVELFFVITSIWLHNLYCYLVFLLLAFLFFITTCVSTSVVHCYFQLCRGDYLWWWRSFFASGSSALYLFLYAAYYYTQFKFTEPVPAVVYFGYALVGSFALFVLAGTVGFLACVWFTRTIYSCQVRLNVEAFGSQV